jgi:hypothetical protein
MDYQRAKKGKILGEEIHKKCSQSLSEKKKKIEGRKGLTKRKIRHRKEPQRKGEDGSRPQPSVE